MVYGEDNLTDSFAARLSAAEHSGPEAVLDVALAEKDEHVILNGFPLADAIETVLQQEGVQYSIHEEEAGFDVRVATRFDISLPARRARGLMGLLRRKIPIMPFSQLIEKINSRVYTEIYPNRTGSLKGASILTQDYARYVESSPEDKATNWGCLDVVAIKLCGYFLR